MNSAYLMVQFASTIHWEKCNEWNNAERPISVLLFGTGI